MGLGVTGILQVGEGLGSAAMAAGLGAQGFEGGSGAGARFEFLQERLGQHSTVLGRLLDEFSQQFSRMADKDAALRAQGAHAPFSELLSGSELVVRGAGALGLAVVLVASSAGASVCVKSERLDAPCAMSRALGIFEYQGDVYQELFGLSYPILQALCVEGSPVRRAPVTYYYRSEAEYDLEFARGQGSVQGSEFERLEANENSLSGMKFQTCITYPAAYRHYLISLARARGVVFEEAETHELTADPDANFTVNALGVGYEKFRPETVKRMLGQIISFRGNIGLEGNGAVGLPSPNGSVNIVQHFDQNNQPIVLVGATKRWANHAESPSQHDYDFLTREAFRLFPPLRDLEQIVVTQGVRPYCPNGLQIVTEPEGSPNKQAVTLMGAAGSGLTVNWGVALKVLQQAVNFRQKVSSGGALIG